jgi:TonB family protein
VTHLPKRRHLAAWTALLGFSSPLAWAEPAPNASAAPSASAPSADLPPSASAPSASSAPSAAAPEGLVPPKLRKDVQPEYPRAAREQGLAASVLLEIDIDVTGLVQRAAVAQPSETPGYGFEEAALAAGRQLEFEPALEGGKPIPVTVTFRFRFVPEVATAPLPPPAQLPDALPRIQSPPPSKPMVALPSGELWGRLLERGTRLPLVGTKVTVFRGEGDAAEGFETETDADGRFHLTGLGVGDWRVLADPEGYYPLRTTEAVKGGSRTEVSYAIERSSYNPYDVVVETERVQREVNQVTIDARQAERVPGTFGDVLEVVRNFPGVGQTSGGEGPFGAGLVIRGSAPEDSRIYVSSIDVPLLYHFGDLRSVLPVGMLQSVNFHPGNFSVQYGRATGGIVDITLAELNRQQFGGYFDFNLFDSSLYLEAPLSDDLSVAIAGRRSYIDVLLNAVLPDTGGSLVAPRYYDAQLLATYRPSAAHLVKAFFFLSDDRFELVFDNPASINAQAAITDVGFGTNFYRGIVEYKYVPGPDFENELKVSLGRDHNSFNLGDLATTDEKLFQSQIRNTARYTLRDSLAVRGGLDYLLQRRDAQSRLPDLPEEGQGNGEPSFTEATSSESKDTFHSIAGFAELEWRPWQTLLAVPGFRFEHFGRTDEFAASPRLVLRQSVARDWVVKGGIGLFQQEPTFEETTATSGNPELGLEKAVHYSAGFEYVPRPHLNFGVTGFYKSLHDLVSPTDALTSRAGETVPLNYDNGGSGRVLGLEVSAKHELTNDLFAWVAYTLSKSERKDTGDANYRLFDHDQTHIVTVIGSYRLPKNWEIGSRFRYVTGQLYTPVSGAVFDADADSYAAISGPVNSSRVNAFHQLDIRIDKRWVYESWMLNAYLDIQNVYNQANASSVEYNYDYSEEVPDTGLPIVPVLGLRGEF